MLNYLEECLPYLGEIQIGKRPILFFGTDELSEEGDRGL
jgi:hypothetical protein